MLKIILKLTTGSTCLEFIFLTLCTKKPKFSPLHPSKLAELHWFCCTGAMTTRDPTTDMGLFSQYVVMLSSYTTHF